MQDGQRREIGFAGDGGLGSGVQEQEGAGLPPKARALVVGHPEDMAKFSGARKQVDDLRAFTGLRDRDQECIRLVERIETKQQFGRLDPERVQAATAQREVERIQRVQRTAHASEHDAPQRAGSQVASHFGQRGVLAQTVQGMLQRLRLVEDVLQVRTFNDWEVGWRRARLSGSHVPYSRYEFGAHDSWILFQSSRSGNLQLSADSNS